MKKRIAVEIETSEDGKYCSDCEHMDYRERFPRREFECICDQFHMWLSEENCKVVRCPACTKAECKDKEVNIAKEK
jgi:hypothetical protein